MHVLQATIDDGLTFFDVDRDIPLVMNRSPAPLISPPARDPQG
jgi:hypothetical protein